ncbi:MAG TPA: hypothetical protein VHM90_03455 [Phycisphaerae bacterium]|nr:hypothetical protein [Phycisphaerae bacterium]
MRLSNVTSKENMAAWHAPLVHSDFYETYTCDGLNRLTATDRYNGTANDQSWNLDSLGNITGVTTDAILLNRTSNSLNQLPGFGGNALSYDAAGYPTQRDQGHVLIYDGWNRLIMVASV